LAILAGVVVCLAGEFSARADGSPDSGLPRLSDQVPASHSSRDPSISPERCGADPAQCFAKARAHWWEQEWTNDRAGLLKAYAIACEGRVSRACDLVGEEYLFGGPLQKDGKRAIAFFEFGCLELKAAESCTKAGAFYARNIDDVFRQDYRRAVEFYSKGCDLGSALSCYEVSLNLRLGRGVDKDPAKGKKYMRRARALGFRYPHEGERKPPSQ
jgi:TPR repeat protein